ncbi:GIN domain-containing protein [Sphingomonas parapaucimobilis]|uniref:GIN domain-containing protein n=1 Tax=Sphingomonas parapaucimobilis TaxID=28213 RepID=UPI00321B458E
MSIRTAFPLLASALVVATPALGAERRVDLSSFDKLRVEGPFRVIMTTGPSPRGALSGDGAALRQVEAQVMGSTLVVRRAGGGAEGGDAPVTLTLIAPPLSGVTVIGGAQVTVQAMKGSALNMSVTGTGEVRVGRADGDQLAATLFGPARLTIEGGRVGKARLAANGPASIAAEALEAGDLTVTLDGPGEIAARARYMATVANGGLGKVTVAGTPKCRVTGGGPVRCGVK